MSNYNSLKTTIDANIKQNGNQEITGQILNSVLNAMVTTLGAGYQFAGVATTATNPGSPDAKVFYIANGKGTYTNFSGLEVTEDEVVVLYWDSSWHKVSTGIASQEKLTELDSQIADEAIARTEADAALQTQINGKQDALTLTVKDNGNIVLANIQGQSKEFMPATPSGDPMHYYYISLGMKYNNGFFQLNGLNLTASEALETLKSLRIVNQSSRVNGCRRFSIRTNIPDNYETTFTTTSNKILMHGCFFGIKELEVVNIANNTNIKYPIICELNFAFEDCINLKKVIDYIKPTNASHAFFHCSSLSSVNLVRLSISISFESCSLLSSESVLFMIQNEEATSPITITLHADAYARAMADSNILVALGQHTNISLASA